MIFIEKGSFQNLDEKLSITYFVNYRMATVQKCIVMSQISSDTAKKSLIEGMKAENYIFSTWYAVSLMSNGGSLWGRNGTFWVLRTFEQDKALYEPPSCV